MKTLYPAVAVALLNKLSPISAELECLQGSFYFEFEGECTYETLLEAYEDEIYSSAGARPRSCTTSAQNDFDTKLATANTTAEELCKEVYDTQESVPFHKAAHRGRDLHFEQMFYNGRTDWQEEVETIYENDDESTTSILNEDAEMVRVFYEGAAQGRRVEWPDLPNFRGALDSDGLPTCTTNAAMCCWPKDRQANDGSGNCAKGDDGYDVNCVSEDPGDNTDLCYVDVERGSASTGLSFDDIIVYNGDNNNGEGSIHCHGLAWSNDVLDHTARYKANNLFYISMYDHMYKRGYVENIPGAPMCGCVEQMPTVTRSDCSQVNLVESVYISFNSRTKTFSGKLTQVGVTFGECKGVHNRNNDLWAYMARLFYQGDLSPAQFGEAGRIITNGGCDEATQHGISEKGYRPGFDHDVSEFTLVAGRDDMKLHAGYGKLAFEQSLARGANPSAGHFGIIRRVCQSCASTHKDIFYRRLTVVPADKNLLRDILYMDWETAGNKWDVDFSLHSSLDDAVSDDNRWSCRDNIFRYSSPFYGECSPDGTHVQHQRSLFHHDWYNGIRRDVAFYVLKPEDEKFESMTESAKVHAIRGGSHGRADALVLKDKDDESIYMASRGVDIWHASDDCAFYGEEFSGDYSVVVKVDSISPSGRDGMGSWSKIGIMFRSTLDPDSEHYTLMLTGNQGMGPQWRPTRGAQTTWGGWNHFINRGATEAWLKLQKRGDILMSYIGTEEGGGTVAWESLHTMEMKLEETYFIGLAMSSQNSYAIEARFSNFEVAELANVESMTNLALGKPVMQSSIGWGGVGERAVDGNTSGYWNDGSVTHTINGDLEPSFVLDLVEPSLIQSIYIYGRTDCCTWRSNGALVELIHEGNVVGTRHLHGNMLDILDFSDASYVASRVRVSYSSQYMSIAEIEVYGVVTEVDGEAGSYQLTNLALNKPVEQSTSGWGGVAERAVDGNTNGHWWGGSVTHTLWSSYGDAEPWFKLDLLQPSLIRYIKLFGRTDCCSWRTRNAIVELILGDNIVCTRTLFGSKVDVLDFSTDSCIASEIRVTPPNGQPLSIAELEVYGMVVDNSVM